MTWKSKYFNSLQCFYVNKLKNTFWERKRQRFCSLNLMKEFCSKKKSRTRSLSFTEFLLPVLTFKKHFFVSNKQNPNIFEDKAKFYFLSNKTRFCCFQPFSWYDVWTKNWNGKDKRKLRPKAKGHSVTVKVGNGKNGLKRRPKNTTQMRGVSKGNHWKHCAAWMQFLCRKKSIQKNAPTLAPVLMRKKSCTDRKNSKL